MSPISEPVTINTIPSPPRIVRTNFPIRLPLRSFTTAANNAITSRLQENPVIGNNRWVLRTPTPAPSYSGMDLSAVPSRTSTPGPPPYSGMNLSLVPSRISTPGAPPYSGMNLSGISSRPTSLNQEQELQKAFEAALENNDERNRAERDAKRELKAQSKRILKGEFERGQTERIPYVDEKDAYRQYVLSHSLFPNLYNQKMVMTQLGAS
jgi:hypothetical protein